MKSAILILGAGSSSRMKSAKQLLPYKSTTLLGFAIEQAEKSTINAVFCVLGANFEVIKNAISSYNSTILLNPNYKNGLSSSIKTGIKEIQKKGFDNVLILLADQPEVDANYINLLQETFLKNPSKIIASSYLDNLGVPAIFSKKYFNLLLNLEDDIGAKKILKNLKDVVLKIENKHPFIDIDTPKEYKKLMKHD